MNRIAVVRRTGAVLMLALAAAMSGAVRAAEPMGVEDARHLLSRAGFGGSPTEIADYARLDRAAAVDRLLAGVRTAARTAPPAFVEEPFVGPRTVRAMSEDERREFIRDQLRKGFELRGWWLEEMIGADSPLTERMTLFWHNHFVSSQQKVRSPRLMYRQNVLLRRHALGNFADLLHAIARDPAMVVYLDSATNRKGQPNENFARELMELFTLGEGHYGEQDIREAARAFTGWSLDPETGDFRFRPALHDGGEKTVLGRRGTLGGDDVIDVLLAHPATANLVVTKLWREFVSLEPDAAEVSRIAARFRAARYDIRVAVRDLLVSDAFWAAANRGALVKSPIDLVVGTVRQFDVDVPDALPLALVSAQLGQNLFAPPNVKGWPGGEAWINSASLLARKQFLERLFRGEEMPNGARAVMAQVPRAGVMGDAGRERVLAAMASIRMDTDRWLAAVKSMGESPQRIVLAAAPVNAVQTPAPSRRAELRQLVLDPSYQVK